MVFKNNHLSIFRLELRLYFIHFTIFLCTCEKISKITILECGQCNDSFSGTKSIISDFHIEKDYKNDATIMVGNWDFHITFDDSFTINWIIYRVEENNNTLRRFSSIKFNRGCSDMLTFVGGMWKNLWDKDMPSKCPIPKGSYTFCPVNLNPFIKRKSLFIPQLLSGGGLFYISGELKKKRSGLVAGCLYFIVNFND